MRLPISKSNNITRKIVNLTEKCNSLEKKFDASSDKNDKIIAQNDVLTKKIEPMMEKGRVNQALQPEMSFDFENNASGIKMYINEYE